MKPGEGIANFLFDLSEGVSDKVMRERWKAGNYRGIRPHDAKGWRQLAGRKA